jgi:hypothetical protein
LSELNQKQHGRLVALISSEKKSHQLKEFLGEVFRFFLQLHIFVSFTAVAQERRTGERGFSTIKVSRTDSICHGSNQPEMMHCIGAFFSLVADKQGLIK